MKYKLQDLIDMEQFQYLQDKLNEIYSFPSAILDNEGNILTATAWQDICTQFHRKNKDCERDCLQSDRYILSHLHEANPAVSYRCPRGLVDNATPIIIDGIHYGNFFTGQFFLEKPDLDFFRVQAKTFGFDETAYLEAVKKVPIWSQEQLNSYLFFIKGLILIISESGLKKMREMDARKQIDASEERFRRLAEDMPMFISTFLPDGTLTYVNPLLAARTGMAPSELVGLNFFAMISPADRAIVAAQLSLLSPENPMETHDQHYLTPQGEDRIHQWTNRAFFDAGGQVVHYQAVGQDITERKQVEESLRQSNETAQIILNAATESVFLMNGDGMVLAANETTALRLGKGVVDLVGRNIYDILPPEVAEFRKKQVNKVLREGKPIRFEDERWGVLMENNIYPILDPDGQVRRVAVYGRDITERMRTEKQVHDAQIELKRLLAESEKSRLALLSLVEDQKEAEEQIRRLNAELEQRVADRTSQLTAANQELKAFSYSVSHDLRAPLRALDGFSAALLEDYAGQLDEQGQNYLTRIQEATRRMAQLIEDLLGLSRITQREVKLNRVDLSLAARQIAAELQAQAPERQVRFEIDRDLIVQADPNLIMIALENLLRNAFKFTNRKELALIQFGMIVEDEERVFFVRDNGAGFNMAYADKLFIPFQRLHGAREYPGTGIGLSIVQRIIARHGGRIWPEAVENQGATFYFTLGGE